MANIFQNLGNYFSNSDTIEKFFNTGLQLGSQAINTGQQVSQIQAETERMKAELLLEQQRAANAQLNRERNNNILIVAAVVLVLGGGIYYYTKK